MKRYFDKMFFVEETTCSYGWYIKNRRISLGVFTYDFTTEFIVMKSTHILIRYLNQNQKFAKIEYMLDSAQDST